MEWTVQVILAVRLIISDKLFLPVITFFCPYFSYNFKLSFGDVIIFAFISGYYIRSIVLMQRIFSVIIYKVNCMTFFVFVFFYQKKLSGHPIYTLNLFCKHKIELFEIFFT